MAGTEALTIETAARISALAKKPQRMWLASCPLAQILGTGRISPKKVAKLEQIAPVIDMHLKKAEYYKIKVNMYKPSKTQHLSPGGAITFGREFRLVPGKAYPKTSVATYTLSTLGLKTNLPAAGNEGDVNMLALEKLDAMDALFDSVESDLCAATQAESAPTSIVATILDASKTLHDIAPGDHAAWIPDVTAMGGSRTRLAHLKAKSRYHAARGRQIGAWVGDEAAIGYLISEAEDEGYKTMDLASMFGRDGKTGENKLYLETSIDSVKVCGAPLVPVPALSTTAPGLVFGFPLDDLALATVGGIDFKGPKDVSLEAAVDETRGMISIPLIVVCYNRTTMVAFTGGKH
jgi:hypothetical protein